MIIISSHLQMFNYKIIRLRKKMTTVLKNKTDKVKRIKWMCRYVGKCVLSVFFVEDSAPLWLKY